MKVRLEYMSFYLFIGTLLLTIGCGDTFTCPEHCSCSEVQRKRYNYNHAKCTSLDGLRQLGKTSELHSLDLSSMNLTKINNQLDKLTNLSKLDLSDNHLSDLSNLHQRRIRFLNVSGNRITSGKLAKIPTAVKHLNLSHNDITILPENFKLFVHLKSLELADNPLNCTCETLDIRNWLQERKVWTEKPIRCMAPLQFKGRSWLQIRQSEVCDPNGLDAPRMLPSYDGTDDENDLLMMGDDPNAGENDAIESDFIPVNDSQTKRTDFTSNVERVDDFEHSDDGSGSKPDDEIQQKIVSTTETTDAYEGSGDDNSTTDKIIVANNNDNDVDNTNGYDQSIEYDTDSDKLITPMSLNSAENDSVKTKDTESEEKTGSATEETISPSKTFNNDAEIISSNGNGDKGTKQESTKLEEPVQESKSTYILLAILGILLIGLLLYVATKRSQTSIKNRRNNNDIENPAHEMKAMDKNNLGKPIQNPVEFIPLIPDKHDPEKKPNLCNGEEPLLQKLNEVEKENGTNEDGKLKATSGNKHTPTQQLNGNAKPVQNGVHSDKINDNANDQRPFQPISPKPPRYSPVYSHDTGRVKIKLSETSRPKTPILVTRSRSNAGDNKFENTISQ